MLTRVKIELDAQECTQVQNALLFVRAHLDVTLGNVQGQLKQQIAAEAAAAAKAAKKTAKILKATT